MSDDPDDDGLVDLDDDGLVDIGVIHDAPSLGSCCNCGTVVGVRNLVMLDRRCVVPGHGWGCVVCGLPCDGAVAVLCDGCLDACRADPASLRFACRGYPATDGRVALAELPGGEFWHDDAAHARDDLRVLR